MKKHPKEVISTFTIFFSNIFEIRLVPKKSSKVLNEYPKIQVIP